MTARAPTARRLAASLPSVSETKIGTTPGGSITTKERDESRQTELHQLFIHLSLRQPSSFTCIVTQRCSIHASHLERGLFLSRLALLCGGRGGTSRRIIVRSAWLITPTLTVSRRAALMRSCRVGDHLSALVLPSLKDFLLKTFSGDVIRHRLRSPFATHCLIIVSAFRYTGEALLTLRHTPVHSPFSGHC
jgi:hypothetical protein